MNARLRLTAAILTLALFGGVSVWALGAPGLRRLAPPAPRPVVERASRVHPDRFFFPREFYAGLRAAEDGGAPGASPEAEQSEPRPLAGGLVPHHLVAGALISDFFLDLVRNPPSTIILVGPNHDNRGARMATSRLGWATPFGTVAPDRQLIDCLARDGWLVVDDEALSPEHSLGGLMPYISYHLPKARVVPIALHGNVSLAEVERLAAALAPAVDQGAVLVASVDFSHYLTGAKAEERDRETWRAIVGQDLPAIMRLGNDHLDSPASLALLLATMRRLEVAGPTRTAHTNSGELMGSDFAETTSYMVLEYHRGH